MKNEIWKPVIGYEKHYEVSNMGNVRTIERIVKRKYDGYSHNHTIKSRVRKLSLHTSGYVRVSLCKNGKVKYYYVHSLVLSSFIGIKQNGYDCDHIDKNRQNNKLSNPRYLLIKENRGIIGNKNAKKTINNG